MHARGVLWSGYGIFVFAETAARGGRRRGGRGGGRGGSRRGKQNKRARMRALRRVNFAAPMSAQKRGGAMKNYDPQTAKHAPLHLLHPRGGNIKFVYCTQVYTEFPPHTHRRWAANCIGRVDNEGYRTIGIVQS